MHRFTGLAAFVMTVAMLASVAPVLNAQMPQGKPKPQSFVEAMLSDATLSQRYRPIPDPDRYLADMGNLPDRSDDELRRAADDLGKMRRIDGRNWQEIQRARQNSKFRLPLDQPIYVARLYEEANRKQREIGKIDDEENQAFKARFGRGFSMRTGILAPTPQEREMIREWNSSGRGDPYVKRRTEVNDRFNQRVQEISTEYRNQTDPGEKYLDQLQREVLSRYGRTLIVQRTIQAEIDRRSRVEPPPPEKPNEARDGTLVVSSSQSKYDLKVGEVADIDMTISGGKPPYKIWVKTQEQVTLAELTLREPGNMSFPVSFPKEGNYIVAISVEDDTPTTRNFAILNLEFRVTDEKPAEPESPQPPKPPDTKKPQTPSKPKDPPKPETLPTYTPWKLQPGQYEAHLWHGMSLVSDHRKRPNKTYAHPLPIRFSIDAGGKITGTVDWKLDPREFDPAYLPKGSDIDFEVMAKVEGFADGTTGKIDLKILDGHKKLRTVEPITTEEGGVLKATTNIRFRIEMTGWQFGQPTYDAELNRIIKLADRLPSETATALLKKNDGEIQHLPRYVRDADGRFRYLDRGWGGIPDSVTKDGGFKYSPGPGGFCRTYYDSYTRSNVYPKYTRNEDLTAAVRNWDKPMLWHFRIIGQKPTEPPPVPAAPSPASIKGELAAFGVWPRGELKVKPGEAFELDAMGVFLNAPYEAVNLNDKATWTLPDGLVRGPDGKVKATKPGTYETKVSITRPDGHVMSDTIRITVK